MSDDEWSRIVLHVRVDVYRGGATTVRITHLPSGHVAEAGEPEDGRSEFGLRQVAQGRLVEKLRGTEWLEER